MALAAIPVSVPGAPSSRRRWLLVGIAGLGLLVRLVLLPTPGWVGDVDQFVEWVRHIGTNGLANAYDAHLSFGPVMAYVWGLLGVLHPGIVAAADSSDATVRVVMKLPAVVADLALAGAVWASLRGRPPWADVAFALVWLHPAIWFTSAWWGQYDSVYTAFGLIALLGAIRGRDTLAVAALTLAVLTKPQALPLVIPFAAWYLARAGWGPPGARTIGPAVLRLARLAAVGIAVFVVLWLPFLAAGGPLNYLRWLAMYQGENYAVLSISAWNLWWPPQEILANGKFVLDSASLVGGLSFRVAGYVVTALLLAAVGIGVARNPTPRTLALGLAAAVLVAFSFLTTMHERYAYAALPLLALLLDERRMRSLVAVAGLLLFAGLLAASGHYIGVFVPLHGPFGIVASLANLGCVLFLLLEVGRAGRRADPGPALPGAAINEGWRDAGTRPGTSGGSAAATSAA